MEQAKKRVIGLDHAGQVAGVFAGVRVPIPVLLLLLPLRVGPGVKGGGGRKTARD